MRIDLSQELTTLVEVDGAVFEFGTADRELLAVNEALTLAAPIIVMSALALDMEAFAKLSNAEVSERLKGFRTVAKDLPPGVQLAMCELFVAAVRDWDGVIDEQGKPLKFSDRARRDFPTDQRNPEDFGNKVAVVCEYLNVRKGLAGKESGLGEQAGS